MKVWFYSLFKLKSCCRALSGMNRLDPVRSLLNLEATQGVTCHDGAGGLTHHGSSEGCDGFSFRSRKAVVSRTRRICALCKMFVANGSPSVTRKFVLAHANEDCTGPYVLCFSCHARARFLVVCSLVSSCGVGTSEQARSMRVPRPRFWKTSSGRHFRRGGQHFCL